MNRVLMLLSLLTIVISPAAGLAKLLELKETGTSLQCNAVHDCDPPLDCGDGTSNECTPRTGYCDEPFKFSIQPLSAVDPGVTASFLKVKFDDVEFVLTGQKSAQISVFMGETPLADTERWQIILSDSGQFGIEAKLTKGIPSIRSYKGTCGEEY